MLKIAIVGANGRMGRMLVETILQADDCMLVGAADLADSPGIGRDAGEFLGQETGVKITASLDTALTDAQFLIDFTRPVGSLIHLQACVKSNCAMIIGTTGFDEQGKAAITEAAEHIPIVFAPNMSVGVNAMFELLEVAAKILGDGYDVEVIEAHHRDKVDAPSGTALGMGEVVAKALGRNLDDVAEYERYGQIGARKDKTIGFSTIRGGDIVGDHTVLFAGIGERIEITHKAANRMTYAQGGLRACRFLAENAHAHGQFDMQQVLGLKDS